MHKTFFILFFTLLFSASTSAQVGFGMSDCGEWIKSPNSNRKAWLLGYLSGMNAQHFLDNKKPADPLNKMTSAEQAYLWVDNYCKANPLDTVAAAGWGLFQELKAK